MKRVVLAATVSLATLLAAALLWRFRGAASLFVVSLAVAATVRPLVRSLEPHFGRTLALVVVYLAGLTVLGMFAYVVSHGFLRELDEGLDRIGAAYDRLRSRAPGQHGPLYLFALQRLPPAAAVYRAISGARQGALLDGLLGVTLNAMDVAGQLIIVVALSAYWSTSRERFETIWLSLCPAAARARAREIWRSIEEAVGAHLRSEIGQSLLAVLLIGLAFRLAHLPTPMLPALAAGVFRLVPFFGAVIAVGISFLAGNAVSPAIGLAAAGHTLLVLVLLDRGLARHLFAARRYSSTLTVFLIVALVDAYGILGVLIASPLAAAIQVFIERVIATHPRKASRARSLADIVGRIGQARERLLAMPPEQAAQLGNVVARLGALATEARRATEGQEKESLPARA